MKEQKEAREKGRYAQGPRNSVNPNFIFSLALSLALYRSHSFSLSRSFSRLTLSRSHTTFLSPFSLSFPMMAALSDICDLSIYHIYINLCMYLCMYVYVCRVFSPCARARENTKSSARAPKKQIEKHKKTHTYTLTHMYTRTCEHTHTYPHPHY